MDRNTRLPLVSVVAMITAKARYPYDTRVLPVPFHGDAGNLTPRFVNPIKPLGDHRD